MSPIVFWLCVKCGTLQQSDTEERHKLDMCPGCEKAGVDAEPQYTRTIGKVKLMTEAEARKWQQDKKECEAQSVSERGG
jgi:hypothetical protein